ncbi:MAG TPA: hypothetical protein VLL07_06410, partial [Pontiella sp.]|nr:hypothetical protein [Pontiella sp.]
AKKKWIITGFLSLMALPFTAEAYFSKVEGMDSTRFRNVAVSSASASFIAVASDKSLYVSEDGGESFRRIMMLKDEEISHLHIDRAPSNIVYLAGSRHCYQVGNVIERIFSANEGEQIRYILKHKGMLYIATTEGLYYSDAALLKWNMVPGLKNRDVYSAEAFGENIYLACDAGAYLFRPDGTLQRLFASRGSGAEQRLTPSLLKVDVSTPARLWLCTNRGVFISDDRGGTWQKFYISGADNADIYCLAQFPLDGSHVYLCSDIGFIKVDIATGNSEPLFQGLPTSKTRWMDFTADGEIFLATDLGLFKSGHPPDAATHGGSLQEVLKGEPPIHEVHEAAMRYNSVHPDKTEKWRQRLKYRALFPKFSVDYDKSISTYQGRFVEGPNEWGMSLSWDIGNLVWNTYEDDVDNRAKLTTQLRMDILDEVNRLYFERLRLKREIAAGDPQQEEIIAKTLRLSELTATLNGYTGGLFIEQ